MWTNRKEYNYDEETSTISTIDKIVIAVLVLAILGFWKAIELIIPIFKYLYVLFT